MFHKHIVLLAAALIAHLAGIAQTGYRHTPVPFTAVRLTPGTFWADRIEAAREVTIPLAFSKCESEGRYRNFRLAAHPDAKLDVSAFMLFPFDDTDVYKTIEGACYAGIDVPDSVIRLMADAQLPDGYLYTARTINPERPHRWSGSSRWVKEEDLSHELYNLGHMVDAACAHYQATGSTSFLDIARRYADCVVREVGPAEHQATVVPGHQIAEMALARLYVLTGDRRYLDEARFLLDYRGRTAHRNTYSQSHQPVTEQREAVGHAVRAGYMYAGMADVAALTGDTSYIYAVDRICDNILSRKYYLTGGVGARHDGEAFGADYELPNLTAYNETCAAIAMVYLFHRMFLLHGDAKYIDCLERTLLNGVISGMSVDGGRFFYPNPLASDGSYRFNADGTLTRQPWFGCACCPSNLCRFIPSVPGYMYAIEGRNVFVNLFAASTATLQVEGGSVAIEQQTDYPWQGTVALRIADNSAGRFTLKVRVPGWVRNEPVPTALYHYADQLKPRYELLVNGRPARFTLDKGYAAVSRKWRKGDVVTLRMDMLPRLVEADSHVEADQLRLAVERGPLVYCAEQADNRHLQLSSPMLSATEMMLEEPDYAIANTEADGQPFAVTAVRCLPSRLVLIPYYAWNHRGAGRMAVWL